jgi:hypothetical protein
VSDEHEGHEGEHEPQAEDPPAKLRFPSYESMARTNALIRLLDRQRMEHATPATELTQVDRQPLLDAGFTDAEIDSAVGTQRGWERAALSEFGRIGRDPERMTPFLQRLGEVWKEHAGMRFIELVARVASMPPGLRLTLTEEPGFLEHLEGWAAQAPEGEPADAARAAFIDSFLARFLQRWSRTPDTRFGQLVVNLGREDERYSEVTDEALLARLGEREPAPEVEPPKEDR